MSLYHSNWGHTRVQVKVQHWSVYFKVNGCTKETSQCGKKAKTD